MSAAVPGRGYPAGTMDLVALHDRTVIERALRRDPWLHLYELGDLDDFFWPRTTWWGLETDGEVARVALLYAGSELPVLVAHGRPADRGAVELLLERLAAVLPRRFYAHLALGAARALGRGWRVEHRGVHERMALVAPAALEGVDASRAEPLGPDDAAELERFFASAYPGHWFDRRMLATGCYYGVREGAALASVAGVHVVSRTQRVAALGNVATAPAHRGKGLARIPCVAACRCLREAADHIGLNVDGTNRAAIAMYEDLGFERVAQYEELAFEPA